MLHVPVWKAVWRHDERAARIGRVDSVGAHNVHAIILCFGYAEQAPLCGVLPRRAPYYDLGAHQREHAARFRKHSVIVDQYAEPSISCVEDSEAVCRSCRPCASARSRMHLALTSDRPIRADQYRFQIRLASRSAANAGQDSQRVVACAYPGQPRDQARRKYGLLPRGLFAEAPGR
ncbi:hypothetical protein NECAME_17514 [Necator americanus]|uniref:Uncharacterized protein n=1 Tax=Necator americanus TaxID=51031 RepID=W2TNG6_NECAM|nr:hypothetical protein NECAME_17514 [Necator americanus]ETN83293.1 hypothetical protein NECAME_17514 [Necator americanus]